MNPEVTVVDGLSPEDVAMLQALYSRSSESHKKHLEKVKQTGSGKFMSSYYVGYNHKSIGDCGSTTLFIEYVSLLAAKAIQDWPLYNGQETSTRYLDMSTRPVIDPVGNEASKIILNTWIDFYHSNQERVAQTVRENYPIKEGEGLIVYERAVKARTFDILRGFLPAGITTQLSWHTNLRQASDHLILLRNHPAPEVRAIAEEITNQLHANYPSSGFVRNGRLKTKEEEQERLNRRAWEHYIADNYTYLLTPSKSDLELKDGMLFWTTGTVDNIVLDDYYEDILKTRPKGCILPHFLSSLGQCHWHFNLDFGSFRDLQRHRNGVCQMPLLTTELGFESWYLDQLDDNLKDEALRLIDNQVSKINSITADAIARQYYTALGFKVLTHVTYGLPAAVYIMELRSGKTIHPTLRSKIHQMIEDFQYYFPEVVLHVDLDPNDWDIRRGTQTITQK